MREKKVGHQIACLLANGFEDSEFRIPFDRLLAAGYTIEIIGTKKGDSLKGYKGKETVKVTRGIDEVRPDEYEGLLIPGGHSPDQLRADPRVVRFVADFNASERPLAAVCHGPQLLMTAGLVQGRTLTAWTTVQGDLRQMGAKVLDQPVVVDRNWITSRKPDDLEAFSARFIDELREWEQRGQKPAAAQATPAQRSS